MSDLFEFKGAATFRGEDHSLGFRHGRIYTIRAYTRGDGKIQMVHPEHSCPYDSEELFRENWDIPS